MKKLLPMQNARVSSKAKARTSREKMIGLAMFALLVILIANEQIRLALLHW